MHKNQKFQRAWTSKKFQSLLFFEDMLWSEKESPIPSFLSCRRLLPWLISYLYCSRLSTEHLTLSSPRANMYLYLGIHTNGLMKRMQCYLGIGNPSGCSLYNWGQWTIHQLCLAEKTEWEHLSWTKSRWAGWVHAEQCWALLSQPDAESSWSRHPQLRSSALCEYNSLELRVQQSWEFRASIGRKRSIRSIPSLTHQHHRLWCLELDEKWFDGFAW